MIKAIPTKDWGVLGEVESNGRDIGDFVIGIDVENGNVKEYVTEKIFVDLVNALQSGEKGFTAYVNIQQVPPLIIRYNKCVLFHNYDVQDHMIRIKDALQEIQTDIIIQSLVESRMSGFERKKGRGMKALEALVRSKTGVNYNEALINYMVQQVIYEAFEDKIGIGALFQEMTRDEIFEFMGAVIEYMLTEETSNERLAQLLNTYQIGEIEAAMNREISYKHFLGLL